MEEISELKVIIDELKIEVLELTNRVLALEKNKTPSIFGGFPENWHDTRKSVLCNKGHNLVNGYRNEGRPVMCDVCKQIISIFTTFKSCRECDYGICSECYGDIYTNRNGYSVPITFVNPPNNQGWGEFPLQNGQVIPLH
jgi:hypothetical protein